MSDTIYSVINLKNLHPKDRVKPGEDVVYSEVNISDRSCRLKDSVKTEITGSSPHSCRWSTVCLGVLCFLLFISLIILGAYLMGVKPKQHTDDCSILVDERNQIQGNYSILANEIEQLLLKLNNMTHLQEQNNQLQNNYTKLEDMKNKLVNEKKIYQQQNWSLQKDKEEIQKNYDALSKLPLLQKYCHPTEKGRVCDRCPQGWKEHNGQCYYFSTNVTTWSESQNNCIKEAAHLVTVNSDEEQDFITEEGTSSYWIGLTERVKERVWRWVDGTDLKQGFWLHGEPDNKGQQSARKKANCVINSNEWRDEPCEDHYRWICETQALLPKPLHI